MDFARSAAVLLAAGDGTTDALHGGMTPQNVRGAVAALALTTASLTGQACYVETVPEPVYAEGYAPAYYDGYVVYFDQGRPYYYANGAAVWIPPGSPYYAGLVAHWGTYGHAYGGWYSHYGYRYRGYRRRGR